MRNLWRARIDGTWEGAEATLGAGFLVAPEFVLTCAHVVQGKRDLRVSFTQAERRDLIGIPATVHATGPWERAGDRGDVAVLRLQRRVDLERPFLLTTPATTTGQLAHGFPWDEGEAGAPLRLNLTSADLVGEWLHVETATPYAEEPRGGFSGAAVYDETTGAVIGMITDYSANPRRLTGRVLPVRSIRRYWEELDDLLDLSWLPAARRRELRAIVHGASSEMDLRDLVTQVFPGFGGHRDFGSVWDAIRYVGEELPGEDRLARFVPRLARTLTHRRKRQELDAWTRRYLPAAETVRPRETAVVVRVDSLSDGYHLTVSAMIDGEPDHGAGPALIDRDDLRTRVEAGFESVRRKVAGTDPLFEFILPQSMMLEPVDEWDFAKGRPLIGRRVITRYVDRLTDVDEWSDWVARSDNLRREPRATPERIGCHGEDPEHLYLQLLLTKQACVLVHASRPHEDLVASELKAGLPVVVWPRDPCGESDHDACTARRLFDDHLVPRISDTHPDDLPELVRTLRLQAAAQKLRKPEEPHCGRGLTLLWDDPSRMPDPPTYMPDSAIGEA
ncbi:trypsin-like peptidase domain-containing protein [Microbispora sp. RL4-1S]|uniref:Trypsin-like peptidase domain-containing protein n=1 Tax=Microbispora oryzae TaxID=2806554 RepID=A0A940WN89_9ACTN|nr:trypsin-like peptidase domain-containing protein [Microbispora oryzae]MBP2704535.1 trypsin-like peptidase domain-containing protein [Microbispora oryzae]